MNSKTLKESGFSEFFPLKEISLQNLPNNTGQVIVLIDTSLSGKPASDVLYIGRAKKPVKKIFGGYLGGSGGKAVKRIHGALFNENYIEKVAISWMSSDEPRTAQINLLDKFKKEHGDYPAWNLLNSPKKATAKTSPKPKPVAVKAKKTKT